MSKMKKILPVMCMLGASALVVSASNLTNNKPNENLINYFNSFKTDAKNYANLDAKMVSTALNKYTAEIIPEMEAVESDDVETIDTLETGELNNTTDNSIENIEKNETSSEQTDILIEDSIINNLEQGSNENEITQDNDSNETSPEELEKFSTLYSLSSDITENCDMFCKLKTELHDAIVETQALIEKVNNNEITLTKEQKLLITEQAQQLKSLGRQLSNSTTALSLSLSDLNGLIQANNQNLDDLSLKYLIVLDNLVNGNEMLQSGLTTMRMMNQMFHINDENVPSNNKGRILYGFQENNNPPVIKDYYIDENNNLQENNQITNNESAESQVIDSYQDRKLKSNIDTYQNSPVNRNIDTFFNTALLDNEFMYGNGGTGNYGMFGGNPYMNNYANYERGNTNDSVNKDTDTQNNDTSIKSKNSKKEKFKLKKNVDTYRDENTPDIKSKLENIKSTIGGFFSKISKSDLDDKIDNPVYKYTPNNSSN